MKLDNKKKLIITIIIICMIIFTIIGSLFIKNISSKVMNNNETKYMLEINDSNNDKIIKLLKDNDNNIVKVCIRLNIYFRFHIMKASKYIVKMKIIFNYIIMKN